MSKEYRNRFIQKVMGETADAVKSGYLLKTHIPIFLRGRMKHYGIYSKYMPKDFKMDAVDTPKETPNEIIRVEASNS